MSLVAFVFGWLDVHGKTKLFASVNGGMDDMHYLPSCSPTFSVNYFAGPMYWLQSW